MRRADRLFQIVQILQHRRVTTAARIAERLAVSERTVYRDMFTVDEIQALVLGARMVESWGDVQELGS